MPLQTFNSSTCTFCEKLCNTWLIGAVGDNQNCCDACYTLVLGEQIEESKNRIVELEQQMERFKHKTEFVQECHKNIEYLRAVKLPKQEQVYRERTGLDERVRD